MLSLFPEILFLAPFSALVLRIALAVVFGYAAWKHFSLNDWFIRILSVIEVAVAATLFVGSWTQAAALLGFFVALYWLLVPGTTRYARSTILLTMVICASLLVTGAGAFAFDLPL